MFLKRFGPYFSYLKPVRVQFMVGLLAGVIAAAASGAGLPFVIKYLVPLVTSDEPRTPLQLALILSSIPITFSLRAVGTFLNAYYMAYAGMHVLEKLRLTVFEKIQHLPLAFFHRNNAGDLMSRVTLDTTQLQTALVKVVNSLIKEPATLIFAIGFLIYLTVTEAEVAFMLIAIASVPACVLPIKVIGSRILKKARKAQAQAGELNNVLNENLASVREVRAYNLETRETNRFAEACHQFFKLSLKTIKYGKALSPMIELVTCDRHRLCALHLRAESNQSGGHRGDSDSALHVLRADQKARCGVEHCPPSRSVPRPSRIRTAHRRHGPRDRKS
jgi:subfamily B ATP-binding cassette protein MsbA